MKLYLEGLGFRATGRLLPISYGMVYAWVKKWGSQVDLPKNTKMLNVWNSMRCTGLWFQKKLLLDLDCRLQIWKAVYLVCLRKSFYSNRTQALGRNKGYSRIVL
ncbi:hypothetical protein EZS27_006655 [termite gut metagenome]|uniref:Transposase n=1 Tax=termite gut metagenome TaxID=433724 RepID=A0A5J4SIV2_9ZZZZ